MTVSTFRINGTLRTQIALLPRPDNLVRRHEMQERLALHGIRNWKMQRPQNRRCDVYQSDPRLHSRRGVLTRKLEQQRNVDRLVVKKNAVMLFSVLAERLAMICHHGDQGRFEETSPPQIGDQLSDDGVGVGNFTIV